MRQTTVGARDRIRGKQQATLRDVARETKAIIPADAVAALGLPTKKQIQAMVHRLRGQLWDHQAV